METFRWSDELHDESLRLTGALRATLEKHPSRAGQL